MADTNAEKRARLGEALTELVEAARTGGPKLRIGLMAAGSELGVEEFLLAARTAMSLDNRLQVVGIGPRPAATIPGGMDWIEAPECEADLARAMETALDQGTVAGAVALHYPFPVGVATIGRLVTPAKGRPLLVASSTGMSAPHRPQAMLLNCILGLAAAKALGLAEPTVGLLNVDAAPSVQRALARMRDKGYPLRFGQSMRKGGGALLRGNDLLAGAVDVCVCDTLTGNLLLKVFAAFTTGGAYESTGWGYGPSAGEGWNRVVSIISRASGAPVIANALLYTAQAVRGGLPARVAGELAAARKAGLDQELEGLAPKAAAAPDTVAAPPAVPTDTEIHGIDVLDMDQAVQVLWKEGVYAEGTMGCTGPVIKLASGSKARAQELLRAAGYL